LFLSGKGTEFRLAVALLSIIYESQRKSERSHSRQHRQTGDSPTGLHNCMMLNLSGDAHIRFQSAPSRRRRAASLRSPA